MKYYFCVLSLVVAVSAHSCHLQDHEPVPTRARAFLKGQDVEGAITFTELPNNLIHLEGTIVGMPAGSYGFHVHEFGDIYKGCGSAGAHFNPEHKDHGHPQDENRHVGDLGNVVFDENKTSYINMTDHLISFCGTHNIIGRTLMLHGGTDDFGRSSHPDSKKTGNAGGRVACGVIGILGKN